MTKARPLPPVVEPLADMDAHAILDGLADPVCVALDRRIAWVNHAWCVLTGFSRAEALGAADHLWLAASDPARVDEIRSAVGVGTPWHGEVRCRRRNGDEYLARATVSPVRRADGAPVSVWIHRDITRYRQAAEQQRASAQHERQALETRLMQSDRMVAIGTLAAGIAHEINTPIQFVGDSAHFLKSAFDDLVGMLRRYREFAAGAASAFPAEVEALRAEEEVADLAYLEENVPGAVQRTLDGAQRVAKIVRAMKEFGHPGSDTQQPADLNHAVETTITVARNELKYVAEVETDYGDLPLVVCHVGGLNQVFLNLLVNAAHAVGEVHGRSGERGSIRVCTRLEGPIARVSITDTGTGIPEAVRDRIFDPFFTTKEVGKGTGQGLAIARNIVVDQHGGRIEVESDVGKGTTFHVIVPVQGREAAP